MVFNSTKPDLVIYVTRLGRVIEFTDGRYETDDLHEIHSLERNRYCTEGEPPAPQTREHVHVAVEAAVIERPCEECESPTTCAELGCRVEEGAEGASAGDPH